MLNLWQELNFGVRLFIDGLLERAGQSQDFKLLKEICDHFENDTSYLDNETLKKNCQYLAIACYFQSHDEGAGFSGSSVSPQFLQKLKNEFTRVGIASYDSNFLKKLIPGDTNSFLDSGFHVNEDGVIKLYSRYTSGAKRINNFGALLHDVCNRRIADDQGVNSWNPTIQLFQSAITTQIPSSPPRPEITPDLNLQGPQGPQAAFQGPVRLPTPTFLSVNFDANDYSQKYDELKRSFDGNGYNALTDFKELKTLYEKQNKAKFYEQIDKTDLDNSKNIFLKNRVGLAFFASSILASKDGNRRDKKTQAFFGANSALAVIEYAETIKSDSDFDNKLDDFVKFACTEARIYDPSAIVKFYKKLTKDNQQIDYLVSHEDEFNFYKCHEKDQKVDKILNLFELQNPPSTDLIKTHQSELLKKYLTDYGAFGEINKNNSRDILQLSDSRSIDKKQKSDFLLFSAIHHELYKLTIEDNAPPGDNIDLPILSHIKETFFKDNPEEYKKFLQDDAYDFLVKLQENDKTPFKTDETKTSIENLLYSVDDLDNTKKKYLEKQALQIPSIQRLVASEDYKKRLIDRGEITDVAKNYESFYNADSKLLYTASSGSDYSEFVNKKEGLRSFLVSGNYKAVDLVKFDDKDTIGCEIDPTRTRYHNITGDKSKERVVNLYSYSRYDETGKEISNRRVFLNESACDEVKEFLIRIEKLFLLWHAKDMQNNIPLPNGPEGIAIIIVNEIKKKRLPLNFKQILSTMEMPTNIPQDHFKILQTYKNFSSDKTNAEQMLETFFENGLQIEGSASIIREYSYPEKETKQSYLSIFCPSPPKKPNVHVRTESCNFDGKININVGGNKVELEVKSDGKAKITNGFEYLPTLRHKAHILKDGKIIQTIATNSRKNQFINVNYHSSIEKKTSSIEQQGYGFYFEKENQIYELRFLNEKGLVCNFGDRGKFDQVQFDKFTKRYTGEYLPSSFPKFSREDNISTRIRELISRNKSHHCISVKDNKYFDIPVYENNHKIDEILSVKNDGDRSLGILPRFRSRSKVGGRRGSWGRYVESEGERSEAGR